MKIDKVRRFNKKKKGSFEIECWLYDWECALLQSALKCYLQKVGLPIATKTWTANRIKELSKALSKLLKVEMADIRDQESLFKKK